MPCVFFNKNSMAQRFFQFFRFPALKSCFFFKAFITGEFFSLVLHRKSTYSLHLRLFELSSINSTFHMKEYARLRCEGVL